MKQTGKLSLSLQSKIGSIVVHADEFLSSDGHLYDRVAMIELLKDQEVQDWIKSMGPLLPVKRGSKLKGQ